MKGQVLRRFPAARLDRPDARSAGALAGRGGVLAGALVRYFPPGTVHVAVVDPGVGSSRDIAVVEAEGPPVPGAGQRPARGRARAPGASRRSCADSTIGILPRPRHPPAERHVSWSRHLRAGRRGARRGPACARGCSGRGRPNSIPGWLEEPVRRAGRQVQRRGGDDRSLRQPVHEHRRDAHWPGSPTRSSGSAGREIPLRRTYSDVRPGRLPGADQFVRRAGGGPGRAERGRGPWPRSRRAGRRRRRERC